MAKAPKIQQLTVAQFKQFFPDEDACKLFLQHHRWPEQVSCPRCGSLHIYEMKAQPFKWECMDCGKSTSYRFSVIAGTIFENTNKSLREWFRVIHFMLTSKKGMSALQIQRMMGFGSYKTAWEMCHKIRTALMEEDFQQLMGLVEVDEKCVGGKNKNRHKDKRGGGPGGSGGNHPDGDAGKTPGAVQRKGNVVLA